MVRFLFAKRLYLYVGFLDQNIQENRFRAQILAFHMYLTLSLDIVISI